MRLSFSLLIFITITFICLLSAQVPKTLSYQGVLTDANGNVVADDKYEMTFRLYQVAIGGTEIWKEIQTVSVVNGIFNAILGSVNPLDLPFDVAYWLEVTIVEGEELSPRIQLTAAAYSLKANSVVDASITTSKIVDGAITQAKLSPGLSLPPGGVAGGDLTGTFPNPTIAANSVNSSKILDYSITKDDILPNLVSSINGVSSDTGNINLAEGTNIQIHSDDASNTITISASGMGGSGTADMIPRFTGSSTLANSNIFYEPDFGGSIGIDGQPSDRASKFMVNYNYVSGKTLPKFLAYFQTTSDESPPTTLEQAYISRNGDAYFRGAMSLGADATIGGSATIESNLDINGTLKVGENSITIVEIRNLAGVTSSGTWTNAPLPSGWDWNNTRVLSAEVKSNAEYWRPISWYDWASTEFGYMLYETYIRIYQDTEYYTYTSYRFLIMKIN